MSTSIPNTSWSICYTKVAGAKADPQPKLQAEKALWLNEPSQVKHSLYKKDKLDRNWKIDTLAETASDNDSSISVKSIVLKLHGDNSINKERHLPRSLSKINFASHLVTIFYD